MIYLVSRWRRETAAVARCASFELSLRLVETCLLTKSPRLKLHDVVAHRVLLGAVWRFHAQYRCTFPSRLFNSGTFFPKADLGTIFALAPRSRRAAFQNTRHIVHTLERERERASYTQ